MRSSPIYFPISNETSVQILLNFHFEFSSFASTELGKVFDAESGERERKWQENVRNVKRKEKDFSCFLEKCQWSRENSVNFPQVWSPSVHVQIPVAHAEVKNWIQFFARISLWKRTKRPARKARYNILRKQEMFDAEGKSGEWKEDFSRLSCEFKNIKIRQLSFLRRQIRRGSISSFWTFAHVCRRSRRVGR